MTTDVSAPSLLDLDSYCARIEYTGERCATAAVLAALHLAHATHIPFENLDVLWQRPIRLDLESLEAKLVRAGRGGYCFEHNFLFAAVLQSLGFSVTRLAARVHYRTQRVLPRTHMALLVTLDGTRWLADVGFGVEGLLLPVPFGKDREARQFAWTYRIAEQTGLWILQSQRDGAWTDLYAFTLEPQQPIDFEIANYYMSTHPDSRMVQTLTVQRVTPTARYALRNREFLVDDGTAIVSRMLGGENQVFETLAREFGLPLAPELRLPLPEPR